MASLTPATAFLGKGSYQTSYYLPSASIALSSTLSDLEDETLSSAAATATAYISQFEPFNNNGIAGFATGAVLGRQI